MFLIQTKKVNNLRGYEKTGYDPFEDLRMKSNTPQDWSNSSLHYEDYEKAKEKCESMIQHSQYKAENIRIVEVVCTFESEIKVKSSKEKYSEALEDGTR